MVVFWPCIYTHPLIQGSQGFSPHSPPQQGGVLGLLPSPTCKQRHSRVVVLPGCRPQALGSLLHKEPHRPRSLSHQSCPFPPPWPVGLLQFSQPCPHCYYQAPSMEKALPGGFFDSLNSPFLLHSTYFTHPLSESTPQVWGCSHKRDR